jgi:hypothetical protein
MQKFSLAFRWRVLPKKNTGSMDLRFGFETDHHHHHHHHGGNMSKCNKKAWMTKIMVK